MSSSYDNAVVQAVEEFAYHDTFGSRRSEPPEEVQVANTAPTSRPPEEDVSHLISEARAEGGREAAARFEVELALERKRVAELVREFQKQREEYYSRVEIELVHLSLAIAAKILHRESQVDRMVVAGLVKVMLERFQQSTKIIVRVRPEDADNWAHYFRDQKNLEIIGDPGLEPKACLLETELGVADLALEAQLKEVEQGFFDLLAQRPDSK